MRTCRESSANYNAWRIPTWCPESVGTQHLSNFGWKLGCGPLGLGAVRDVKTHNSKWASDQGRETSWPRGAKPTLGDDGACLLDDNRIWSSRMWTPVCFCRPPSCGSLSSLILCPSNWNVVLYQKGLNPNVHWSIIHNRQDRETACMSLHRGMVKM